VLQAPLMQWPETWLAMPDRQGLEQPIAELAGTVEKRGIRGRLTIQ